MDSADGQQVRVFMGAARGAVRPDLGMQDWVLGVLQLLG